MLCGEFHKTPLGPFVNFASLSDFRSPYSSLLTLVQSMAALTAHVAHDEEDIFLENGLLSYENPNYHLDPTRIDDALNSNNTTTNQNICYENIYQELDDICNIGHNLKQDPLLGTGGGGPGRKAYATLDIGTMGVDITSGPLTNINSSNINDNKRSIERNGNAMYQLENTEISRTTRDNVTEKTARINKDNQEVKAVPHIPGQVNNDLYAIPVKKKIQKCLDDEIYSPDKETSDNDLPPGWEKHEDNDGPYYWHIKSGTIQREIPLQPESERSSEKSDSSNKHNINNKESDMLMLTFENTLGCVTRSSTSSALDLETDERKRKNDLTFKRRSYPSKPEPEPSRERPIRFAVRSLGWVEIAEEDLTPERSSKAVNKCIVDLSVGKNDLLDVVGRWGDGKDLFMDLDEGALKLIDPENLTVLNTQPIHTIRVWGVGRDNGRDFAYVARDRTTRKHMCHVFRCDMPARTIANTLRDICKKIMIERSLQQNLAKPIVDINGVTSAAAAAGGRSLATRPTNLPTEHRRLTRNGQSLVSQSFPTPMEEPKKVLRAQYLGTTQVNQATGMEVLNEAIDRLVTTVPPEQWQFVNVAVAPSMISIQSPTDDRLIAECRVRYLSFLGIGKLIKHCAFVMHTAQDTFVAHVFYCEPSSGALCKTIEAACKLRYQKCLDAHPQGLERNNSNLHTPGKSIGAALKSIVGSLTGRKSRSADS